MNKEDVSDFVLCVVGIVVATAIITVFAVGVIFSVLTIAASIKGIM